MKRDTFQGERSSQRMEEEKENDIEHNCGRNII